MTYECLPLGNDLVRNVQERHVVEFQGNFAEQHGEVDAVMQTEESRSVGSFGAENAVRDGVPEAKVEPAHRTRETYPQPLRTLHKVIHERPQRIRVRCNQAEGISGWRQAQPARLEGRVQRNIQFRLGEFSTEFLAKALQIAHA